MSEYWSKRIALSQQKMTDLGVAKTEKIMKAYYSKAMKQTITDFEATYEKLLATVGEGGQPTPADLYKLDKYWQTQNQLKKELQKLGDKQTVLLSDTFQKHFSNIYSSTAIPTLPSTNTISKRGGERLINSIWCADGKSWSDRVWSNIDKLQSTLNSELNNCVITGKTPKQLREALQRDFQVSRSQANTLIRTEMAHIQTQAAAERYKDYGIEKYEFLADSDKHTCDICGELDGKIFYFTEMREGVNCPPMHPNDRCTIVPVVE